MDRGCRSDAATTSVLCSQILEVLERSAAEQIFFDIAEGGFDLALGFRAFWPTHHGPAVVVGDESDEGGIENRLARLPAQEHGFFAIVEAMARDAAEVCEGVLVPADQREMIPVQREIDVLAPRETQDVGKAEHIGFAGARKLQGVGAPIHLALESRLGLKAHVRFAFGSRPQFEQALRENAAPAVIAGIAQLLENPLAGDVGVFF